MSCGFQMLRAKKATSVAFFLYTLGRQAYSHTASVSRRQVFPSRQVRFRQKSMGSFHETVLGARSSPLNWLGLLPITVFQ